MVAVQVMVGNVGKVGNALHLRFLKALNCMNIKGFTFLKIMAQPKRFKIQLKDFI